MRKDGVMGARAIRIAAAVGALIAAIAVTTPMGLVVSLWVGAGTIGAGVRASAPVYVAAGALLVLIASVIVALWVSIPGIHRGRRRPAIVALFSIAILLVVLATGAWPAVAAPWLSRTIVAGILAVAGLVLILALWRSDPQAKPLPGLAPAVIGLVATYAAVSVVSALASSSIPQFPRPPWVSQADLSGTSGVPVTAPEAPQLGLAPGQWSSIHNDAWMTDAYRGVALPDPESSQVVSFFAGGDCASLLWNSDGELVAVCVSPTQVRGFVLDPRTLRPLTERTLADRPLATDALTNFSGGGYAILDARQQLVAPLPNGAIARFDSRTLELLDEFAVAEVLLPGEGITSVLPNGETGLWFVGREGSVGIVDTTTGQARAVLVGRDGPVDIENSFALGADGTAYVVTGEDLLRIDDRAGVPEVAWRFAYDRGERRKPGQTSRASGTTPTVFADGRFVAITDNAEPRMNVVVVDVSGVQPQQHCAVPVFGDGESAGENALIAMDDALFVENNYGYSAFAVAGGRTTVPGLAKVDVSASGCSLPWQNDELSIPSLVSKGVAVDGTVLTYTKESSVIGTDAWWFTAVDVGTGEVLWRRLAGLGPMLNNHYAGGYLGPDGSVYIGTISGVVALLK